MSGDFLSVNNHGLPTTESFWSVTSCGFPTMESIGELLAVGYRRLSVSVDADVIV